MAFKSVEQFNEDRYHNLFRLIDDGESADVIFLYQSKKDMLHATVHYVKFADYMGYVHCLDKGCPVCALKRNDGTPRIRMQEKLFIPVYNIAKDQIEFWDRSWNNGFLAQLDREVFNIYANPSEYVFKITRKGSFNDKNTRYTFTAVGRNAVMPYADILAKFNATMPDYYDNIVKEYSYAELTTMIQEQNVSSASDDMPAYVPVPRAGYQSSIPNTYVNAADAVGTASVEIDSDPILNQFDDEDADIDTAVSESEDGDLPNPEF